MRITTVRNARQHSVPKRLVLSVRRQPGAGLEAITRRFDHREKCHVEH